MIDCAVHELAGLQSDEDPGANHFVEDAGDLEPLFLVEPLRGYKFLLEKKRENLLGQMLGLQHVERARSRVGDSFLVLDELLFHTEFEGLALEFDEEEVGVRIG